ncbi:MAG: metallophosphoesterase [Candidatus Kapaibacterium sp.]
MMKLETKTIEAHTIAVMGGTYGNVPALKAALADAKEAGCDAFAFIGDSIGCCGHSDEIVELIRANFSTLVAGNHEQQAAAGELTCGCGYASPEDERISCIAFAYASQSLSEPHRNWLGTWPDMVLLHVGDYSLLLVHGSPNETSEFIYESEVRDEQIEAWLAKYNVGGIVGTHTGLTWHRELPSGGWMANCGAIGKPDHDGDTAVHYGIVTVEEDGLHFQLRRVTYNHLDWVAQLEAEGVDEIFISPLRTGIWTCGLESLPEWERFERANAQ